MAHGWVYEAELAALIHERAMQGRRVSLTQQTALIVAEALVHKSTRPTREQVARMICGSIKCGTVCYGCLAKANAICAAYGCQTDPEAVPKDAPTSSTD